MSYAFAIPIIPAKQHRIMQLTYSLHRKSIIRISARLRRGFRVRRITNRYQMHSWRDSACPWDHYGKGKGRKMPKELYLMRNAETLFDIHHKMQGWCD